MECRGATSTSITIDDLHARLIDGFTHNRSSSPAVVKVEGISQKGLEVTASYKSRPQKGRVLSKLSFAKCATLDLDSSTKMLAQAVRSSIDTRIPEIQPHPRLHTLCRPRRPLDSCPLEPAPACPASCWECSAYSQRRMWSAKNVPLPTGTRTSTTV